MAGYTAGRKVQIGKETTEGTAVAATVIYRGVAMVEDQSEITPVNEYVGQRVPKVNVYEPWSEVVVEFEDSEATFEQLPYWFEAGVEKVTTVGADTGGSGHIYQYDLSNTTENTIRTYTIETGNNQEVNEVNGAFVEAMTLSGAAGEAWMVSGTWRGREMTDAEWTSLGVAAAEVMLFNKTTFSIDTTTIGTTAKTSSVLGFELSAEGLVKPLKAAAGVAYPSGHYIGTPEVTGSITLRHDATGEAEIGMAQAHTPRLLRLTCNGSALTTAGSSYTYKTMKADLAIQYTSIPTLDEDDGDDTVTLEWRLVDQASTQWRTIIVNELAALT